MAETTTKKAPAKKAAVKKTPAPKKAVIVTDSRPKKIATVSNDLKEFAVIETGGKQHIVCVGDIIDVELLGEHKEGAAVTFDKVLMTDDGKAAKVGTPYISGGKVKATYLGHKKGVKLSIIRFKAKSNRSRKIGHRQQYSQVQIDAI